MTGLDWTVRDGDWPPPGHPLPPYGPTEVEAIRACALRACFDESPAYPRRLSPAARIGTAFHRTVETVGDLVAAAADGAELARALLAQFEQELAAQAAEAAAAPREKGLPAEPHRVAAGQRALASLAHRVARKGPAAESGDHPGDSDLPRAMEVEVQVTSRDRLFHGRVDRAERLRHGIRIVDLKSSLRTDLPDRYERQVQMYSFLWFETRGEWPVEAEIAYPLTGRTHRVPIEPERCITVAKESADLVRTVRGGRPWRLANPGDACAFCMFRPWCEPFWEWQSSETRPSVALERASLGLEGLVTQVEVTGPLLQVTIVWCGTEVQLVAPTERFPHLLGVEVGIRLRLIGFTLHGQRSHPRARVDNWSEVFIDMRLHDQAVRSSSGP